MKDTPKINATEKDYQAFKAQIGDFLIVRSGTVGTYGIVYEEIPAIFGSYLIDFRFNKNQVINEFFGYFYQSDLFKNQLKMIIQQSANTNINAENIKSTFIKLPSLAEQKKISDYFQNIDHLISLHQRKLEKLGNIKKSMLEKMFPKDENKVPEIRFKGFNDDWEQHKLENVFKEYSEKNHEELPALTIIQGEGTIERDKSDRNLSYDKSNLSNYKLVNRGDFIVHLRSFEGGLEIAKNTGIISPAYHTFHGENTDSVFYYSYFRSKKFIDIDLKPHVYGIRDGRSIDIEGMKTIKIPYTKYDEQKKIGEYISTLNTLISLHQRKPIFGNGGN